MKKLGYVVALLVLIQVVPYGRGHQNLAIEKEPQWDSAKTKSTFKRVCANCHSHETKWPWYSVIAPFSWLVQSDVDEGREFFNISRWGIQKKNEGKKASEEVDEGEMPPFYYLPIHPEAQLSDSEKEAFVDGLKKTFGTEKEEKEEK